MVHWDNPAVSFAQEGHCGAQTACLATPMVSKWQFLGDAKARWSGARKYATTTRLAQSVLIANLNG